MKHNDFYEDSIDVLRTLVYALAEGLGYWKFWPYEPKRFPDAPNKYRKMNPTRRENHFIMRRKILPCNR